MSDHKKARLQSSHGEIATARIVEGDAEGCIDLETGEDCSCDYAVYIDKELALEMIADYEANIKRLKEFVWGYATQKLPPRKGGGWHRDQASNYRW
jgi:hypothetical protein